jgi:magnesium chelatase subunit I
MKFESIQTLGELKSSNYQVLSIKEELRNNLIQELKKGSNGFKGIWGYEDTVIPDLQRAILAQHNILLLGLRGQAKTKIARSLINLLDEFIPIIKGSELMDNPLNPISVYGKNLVQEMGDNTPIEWVYRDERYIEKLATPDVSISDLIGDSDPIKAASLKLPYSDERVIHFGLIPRSNRCIFAINELPDLQPKIQVSLFNILQEGDIQIRGFHKRLNLDIQFLFTANPEDYTNRGSIVTPLKDRIESQIITHYPYEIETAKKITAQESRINSFQKENIQTSNLIKDLIERVAFEARTSEFIDPKSGVSARLTISAYEALMAGIERRMILNSEKKGKARISDFNSIIPAITGKVELVYEGEQEGAGIVAENLIKQAIKTEFLLKFPNPESLKKKKLHNPYTEIIEWFNSNNDLEIRNEITQKEYDKLLASIPFSEELLKSIPKEEKSLWLEFILHGLAECSQLGKKPINSGTSFRDLVGSIFDLNDLGN